MNSAQQFWRQTYGREIGAVPTSLRPEKTPVPTPVRVGTGDATVFAAAVEVCRVRKVTPLEIYVAHRSYPSPRSTFPTNLLATGTDPTGRETVRFSIDLDRIHYAYGNLRRPLALLEFGHLWMNLDVALRPARLRTVLAAPIEWKSAVSGEVELVAEPYEQKTFAFPLNASAYFDARTSNPPSPDWYDERIAPAVIADLFAAIGDARQDIGAQLSLNLVAHTFDAHSVTTIVTTDSEPGSQTRTWDSERVAGVPRSAISICLPFKAAASVGLDESTLLSSGRIAQMIALLAGARGIAARPLRGLHEPQLAATLHLPLDWVPIYQVRLAPTWQTALTRMVAKI